MIEIALIAEVAERFQVLPVDEVLQKSLQARGIQVGGVLR